jgi:uncharacterized protein DUF2795
MGAGTRGGIDAGRRIEMDLDMSPIDVQKHLAGVDYPATGVDLARKAESNGAPEELVERLRSIGEVDGPDDVMEELG